VAAEVAAVDVAAAVVVVVADVAAAAVAVVAAAGADQVQSRDQGEPS
jgi:hypothetical protein